ncbi:hypothetical protein GCM10011607_28270 [Shewanella inventionis]|uniref:Uncharacterized protein n=1 Tax=Shewanella inventionis TaxID=1738770 RepID=A0ABQ1JGM7_9GAMM|nr:hypothetical protein [Shewanella inventionis]GGB65899.1 hypothetical protein GCM10011607_28270 [Shewanella inventionis]
MNSEQSVKTVFEHAFAITNPALTTLRSGDEVWPLKIGISKLEPFLMSYCTAISSLLNIKTQIKCNVVAVSETSFDVMYEESDELDLASFLLIACDGVEQVLSSSKVANDLVDVSQLVQSFSPKTFGLVVGEMLDSKRLQQGLVSSILKESGVLPIKGSRRVALAMVDSIVESNEKLTGPSL